MVIHRWVGARSPVEPKRTELGRRFMTNLMKNKSFLIVPLAVVVLVTIGILTS